MSILVSYKNRKHQISPMQYKYIHLEYYISFSHHDFIFINYYLLDRTIAFDSYLGSIIEFRKMLFFSCYMAKHLEQRRDDPEDTVKRRNFYINIPYISFFMIIL